MEITLREDLDPDIDFYYHYQFKIYHEPYLIWDRDTWETVLTTCTVYRIEVDGKYAGDVLLEGRGRGTKSIVDLSILPEYQGKGIGKAVLVSMALGSDLSIDFARGDYETKPYFSRFLVYTFHGSRERALRDVVEN